MRYRYRTVDVFTQRPLEGNPLAVFPDASEIGGETLQKIARELNLAETTFVFPATRSDCVAQIRIFTPVRELIFAGHPVIGTSFVLLDEGAVAKNIAHFFLDVKVGPVRVRVDPDQHLMIWLTTPPIAWGEFFDRAVCAEALGLHLDDILDVRPQLLSAGNPTIFIAVKDKEAVDRAWLDSTGLRSLKGNLKQPVCVFVFCATVEGAYSRMFAPEYGIPEDPATGSATGPLAAYMIRHKLVSSAAGTRFHSEQGTKIGRKSTLHVRIIGDHGSDGIEVGGHVTPVAQATMTI